MISLRITNYFPVLGNSLSCGTAAHYFWGPKAGVVCALANAVLSLSFSKPCEISFWWRWEASSKNVNYIKKFLKNNALLGIAVFSVGTLLKQGYLGGIGRWVFEKQVQPRLPDPQKTVSLFVLFKKIIANTFALLTLIEGSVFKTMGRVILQICSKSSNKHLPIVATHALRSATYFYNGHTQEAMRAPNEWFWQGVAAFNKSLKADLQRAEQMETDPFLAALAVQWMPPEQLPDLTSNLDRAWGKASSSVVDSLSKAESLPESFNIPLALFQSATHSMTFLVVSRYL